jgi:ATP-dependent phosphoenolpyruvate carboxykinase
MAHFSFILVSILGRSAKDKYVVKRDSINHLIDWEGDLAPMEGETFDKLRAWAISEIAKKDKLYVSTRTCGADEKYNMKAHLITENPAHNLFFIICLEKTSQLMESILTSQ